MNKLRYEIICKIPAVFGQPPNTAFSFSPDIPANKIIVPDIFTKLLFLLCLFPILHKPDIFNFGSRPIKQNFIIGLHSAFVKAVKFINRFTILISIGYFICHTSKLFFQLRKLFPVSFRIGSGPYSCRFYITVFFKLLNVLCKQRSAA